MERVPEPELMDDPARAAAYAAGDFGTPHDAFVRHFAGCFPAHAPQYALDLGCGPADVTIRFARAYPACRVLGLDASAPMLDLAEAAIARAGLAGRVTVRYGRVPLDPVTPRADTVLSNSLLHHLADPMALWQTLRAAAAPGAALFVMDLMRPATRAAAEQLVETHARADSALLREDFFNSLLAAYRPDEVGAQLARAGLGQLRVEVVSDRHFIVYGEAG